MQEQTISDRVATALHRFPVAFACIQIIFIVWILQSFGIPSLENHPNRGFVFESGISILIVTGIISVAFRLRREAGYQNPTWLKLLTGCFFALLQIWATWNDRGPWGGGHMYILSALLAPVPLLFALPFVQDRDESRLLRFTPHAFVFGVAALAVTGFCAAGLIFLLGRHSDLICNLIFAFFIVFLFPCLCLIGLPRIEEADEAKGEEIEADKASRLALGYRLLAGVTALLMVGSFAHGIAGFQIYRFKVSTFAQGGFFSMLLLLILYLLPAQDKSGRMSNLWVKVLTAGQMLLLLLMEIVLWRRPFAVWPGTGPFLMLIGLFCIAACLILLLAGQKKFRVLLFGLFGFLVLLGLFIGPLVAFDQSSRQEWMAMAVVDGRMPGEFVESYEDARAFLKKIPEERARFCRDLVDLYENHSHRSIIKQKYSENLIVECMSQR